MVSSSLSKPSPVCAETGTDAATLPSGDSVASAGYEPSGSRSSKSTLFHTCDKVSAALRDIPLCHELRTKRGRKFQLKVGPLIEAHRLDIDAGRATFALKAYVERILANQPDAVFA